MFRSRVSEDVRLFRCLTSRFFVCVTHGFIRWVEIEACCPQCSMPDLFLDYRKREFVNMYVSH